jgi:hypothetical protein
MQVKINEAVLLMPSIETSFANKKSAIETVTPMLDKNGKWRVSGHFVK